MSKSPAVIAANKQSDVSAGAVYEFKSGVRARICRVSQLLIDEAVNEIKVPDVPTYFNENTQTTLPNPDDPQYAIDMAEYERSQIRATFDAALLWGIELEEEVPKDGKWLRTLQFYARRNKHIDLEQYNLDDEIELEFVYKKFAAIDADELTELMDVMIEGMTEEDKEKARSLFRGNAPRGTDT